MKKQGTIQFRYGLSSLGKPVSIENAEKGQQYTCLSCGAPLVPRKGEIRQHHFAHKSNPDNCSFETYLHKLTKYFIRTLFEEKQKLIAVREPNMHPCDRMHECQFFDKEKGFYLCYQKEDNIINLLDFDECVEEEPIKGLNDPEKEFVADLLFKSKNLEPILVEIYVEHKCEPEKITSGLRIIEIKIINEDDIEKLLSGNLNTCPEVNFYGFEKEESPTDQVIGKEIWHGIEKNGTYNEHTVNCKEAFHPDDEASWEKFSLYKPTASYEAYSLHKYAIKRIKEQFEKGSTFPISFYTDGKCSDMNKCPFSNMEQCHGLGLITFDLKQFYDTCREVQFESATINLVLSNSQKPEKTQTIIQIQCTHEEAPLKLKKSNHRLIIISVRTEKDIEFILLHGITEIPKSESNNTEFPGFAKFYGFKRKHNLQDKKGERNIRRFYLYQSGKAYVTNKEEFKSCRNIYTKDDNRAIFEASIDDSLQILPNHSLYEIGFIAAKQNGINIKTCQFCKYHRNGFEIGYSSNPIFCCLYKKYRTPEYPSSEYAEKCQYYKEDYNLLNEIKNEMPKYIIATFSK